MPFPKRLLTDDETIIVDLRPHWKMLVAPVFYSLVIAVATGFLYVKVLDPGTGRLILTVAALIVWIAVAAIQILRWRFTEFVLTNERIIARSGVIAKVSKEIPIDRVNDVTVTQSVLDRLLRSGDIRLESAGEYGQTTFDDIRSPIEIQKKIYEAAEARRGLGTGAHTPSVADELSKLADLRDRGALTPEEFEARKRTLLGPTQKQQQQ